MDSYRSRIQISSLLPLVVARIMRCSFRETQPGKTEVVFSIIFVCIVSPHGETYTTREEWVIIPTSNPEVGSAVEYTYDAV